MQVFYCNTIAFIFSLLYAHSEMKDSASKNSARNTRLTPVRKAILQIFDDQKAPLTISEIQKLLEEKNLFPNKTTLYRQMEMLVKLRLIESVALKDSIAHYEKKTSHHHHFICTDCKDIVCIEDENLEQSTKRLEQNLEKNGFRVQGHHFFLEGKCQKCAT